MFWDSWFKWVVIGAVAVAVITITTATPYLLYKCCCDEGRRPTGPRPRKTYLYDVASRFQTNRFYGSAADNLNALVMNEDRFEVRR